MGLRSWFRSLRRSIKAPRTPKTVPQLLQQRPLITVVREDFVLPVQQTQQLAMSERPRDQMSSPQIPATPRMPYNAPPSVLSNAEMSVATVTEVADRLGVLLEHIPHAVSGLAAMTYYGFSHRLPQQVTIICPASSRRVLKCWAFAQGMYTFTDLPDVYGIKTADGFVRRIRVRFVQEDFEDFHIMKFGKAPSSILSLASIANETAQAYVRDLEVSAGRKQRGYARDLLWILNKINKLGRDDQLLTRLRAPRIFEDAFWVPFSLSYPDSLSMFVKAGIEVDDDGSLVKEESDHTIEEAWMGTLQIGLSMLSSPPGSPLTIDGVNNCTVV